MKRQDIADIAYKNGYNRGIRDVLQAAKTGSIILSVLVAACLILSLVTAVKVASFAEQTTAKLTELSDSVVTIEREFKDLAYRMDVLEGRYG